MLVDRPNGIFSCWNGKANIGLGIADHSNGKVDCSNGRPNVGPFERSRGGFKRSVQGPMVTFIRSLCLVLGLKGIHMEHV